MALYQLALLGAPTTQQREEIEVQLTRLLAQFRLSLNHEVSWSVTPAAFDPAQSRAAAAAFVGSPGVSDTGLASLIRRGVPLIPVYSRPGRFEFEIPAALQGFNGLDYQANGPLRVASALLECTGLLPHQRRVFVSYRRQESREAALQLFDEFSRRLFDVFLDTHGIPPAEDFQALLWHRLCDCDVLVMIDTPGYFESRWTAAEFGRALAKNISVLRVAWPGTTVSPRASSVGAIELAVTDVDAGSGRIEASAIERICQQLESSRSESIAVRHLNLVSQLELGLNKIGGAVEGVSLHKGIHIRLPGGTRLVAYPAIGSPTSQTLHSAAEYSPHAGTAIVYDHVGLHANHLGHLDWLSRHIPKVGLVKVSEVAWRFADWEA